MSGAPRRLEDDLARLRRRVEAAAAEMDRALREVVAAEPHLAVAAVAGVGFVLGGGLSPRTAPLLFGVGARLAGAWLEKGSIERAHAQEDTT